MKIDYDKIKFAHFLSIIGHPLLTIPIFTVIVMFRFTEYPKTAMISSLIIGCVFIPVILWMYFKSKNGSYTNFDLSDKKQRKSLFLFVVPLLFVTFFFKTNQSGNLRIGALIYYLFRIEFKDHSYASTLRLTLIAAPGF